VQKANPAGGVCSWPKKDTPSTLEKEGMALEEEEDVLLTAYNK